jgi:hypothetical protein
MKRFAMLFLMLAGLALADVNHDGMPIINPLRMSSTASTTVAMSTASNNDLVGGVFCASKTAISGVEVIVSAVSGTEANRKLTVYITNLDAAGCPDESSVLTNGTKEITGASIVVGMNRVAFTTPPTTVAGSWYGVLVKNTATASETDYFTVYSKTGSGLKTNSPFCAVCTDGGTTWTRSASPCSITPYYSDNTIPPGFYPGISATLSIASDHTPDEFASVFTVTNPTICNGCVIVSNVIANSDLTVKLLEDTATIATVVVAAIDVSDATVINYINVDWPAYSCHAGHTYYISIFNSTTTHILLPCSNQFLNATDKASVMGSVIYGATRADAGSWTTYNSGVDYRVYPIIPRFGVETISGGGCFKGYGG